MDQFRAITTFVEIVAAGSFTAAARRQGVTPTAVSKQVLGLENWAGAKLFIRSTRQVSLTEAGARFHRRAVQILESIHEARAEAGDLQAAPKGLIRISVPMSFGLLHLAAPLSEFLAFHPAIKMEVVLDDRRADLQADGFDLAIRIGELSDSTLVARKIATCNFVLCAAPSYLSRRGTPGKLDDLRTHDCLVYHNISRWTLVGPGGKASISVSGAMSANNGLFLTEAAIKGQGIAYGPRFIMADALSAGDLVEILPDCTSASTGVYAVFLSGEPPMKVRLLLDHLAEKFAGMNW